MELILMGQPQMLHSAVVSALKKSRRRRSKVTSGTCKKWECQSVPSGPSWLKFSRTERQSPVSNFIKMIQNDSFYLVGELYGCMCVLHVEGQISDATIVTNWIPADVTLGESFL